MVDDGGSAYGDRLLVARLESRYFTRKGPAGDRTGPFWFLMVPVRAYSRHKELSHGRSRPQKSRREAQDLAPSEDAPGMVFWHPRAMRSTGCWRTMSEQDAPSGYAEVGRHSCCRRSSGAAAPTGTSSASTCSDRRPANWRWRLKPMSCPCHVQIFKQGAALVAGASDSPIRVRRLPPQ